MKTKKESNPFCTIEEALEEIRSGRLLIVTDDADRENEGDLVLAAEKITPESVNFMLKHARGLICVPITERKAQKLNLQPMVAHNRESQQTAFTITVDAAKKITTGISAPDRAHTISLLAEEKITEKDFVTPGHIHPLQAKEGGVLRRAGHTEAAVDLAKLAGLSHAGVICEIMNEDGSMARLPDLKIFAKKHGLKMCTIAQLIEYRRTQEKHIVLEETIQLPTDYGDFQLHLYRATLNDELHLALVHGEIDPEKPILVRVHSECLTGDIFASRRCDCGSQLHQAMERIEKEKQGVLLYMRQEGRGIGLLNKIRAYKLQEQGLDTIEANEKLGFPDDLRDYGVGAQILHDLGIRKIRLLTNNPKKIVGLEGYQLQITEQVPILPIPNAHNVNYLKTKRDKMGHLMGTMLSHKKEN